MENKTIAAIASPPGIGGIGIIRISGNKALEMSLKIFRRNRSDSCKNKTLFNPDSHKFYHGYIYEEDDFIDEVMFVYMASPRSYTAEDVVEIQAHSGFYVIRKILDLIIKSGVELAAPGEFTKRAFLNGRIELTQAEAVTDVINAKTDGALMAAQQQQKGELGKSVNSIQESILKVHSVIEASIDFPDEVDDIYEKDDLINIIKSEICAPAEKLIKRYNDTSFIRDGIKLVIAGKPNVGKSSLMNILVQRERSIVTDIPGTTRDVVEDHINLNGVPILLSDTAGIHLTEDPVEKIGIERSKKSIAQSNLVLFVIEKGSRIDDNDHAIFDEVSTRNIIIVINKSDKNEISEYNFPDEWNSFPRVEVSAKFGSGVDELERMIIDVSSAGLNIDRNMVIPNLRHTVLLERVIESARNIIAGVNDETPTELISIDLSEATEHLREITGETVKADILDTVFSNFCIGK